MKKIYILLFFVINSFALKAQFVKFWIIEPKAGLFALVNFYTTTKDFSNYRISVDGGVDTPLKSLPIFVGNINVKGRETIAFTYPMGKTDGSISLYLPGDTVNHIRGKLYDYCQWGSAGHQNEDSAEILGLWKKGTFINVAPPFSFKCDEWNFGVQCWQGVKLPIITMRFAYVSPWNNTFCIRNSGVSNMDISNGSICINGTCYDTLSKAPVEIVKGKFDIAKNDSLVLRVTTQKLDTVNGSLALFALTNQKSDTTSLLDFVQWGQGNQAYASLAHQKGIWDSLSFVTINHREDSLRYIGDFTRQQVGVNYWKSFNPTNIGLSQLVPKIVKVNPNPTTNYIYIQEENIVEFTICDLQGKVMLKSKSNEVLQSVSLIDLAPGIYMLTITDKNGRTGNQKIVKLAE